MDDQTLVQLAFSARKNAYVPYSDFAVGAALLAEDGTVYTGCNIESAAYPATICAERTAFAKAVSDGKRNFSAIAVVGAPKGALPKAPCPPCGVCRQVMAEFCKPQFRILLPDSPEHWTEISFGDLLPMAFGAANMEGANTHENR